MADTTERGVSRCWQNNGYHVYGAGPCLDTMEQAIAYREGLDYEDQTLARWESNDRRIRYLPPLTPPAGWVNPNNLPNGDAQE